MNRKRNYGTAETINQLHGTSMEPSGPLGRTDADFVELEPDEELLCSVSDITEHLGRNITMVLETALSEIRKMVSIRIRVLKMELREKSQEIEVLKARLDGVQKDSRECFPGAAVATNAQPATDAGFKKTDFNKQNNNDARRAKGAMSGIKKENIDAICDYLMKDKNSRGSGDIDGEQSSHSSGGREVRLEQESSQSLHLWPDSGMTSVGSGHDDSSQAATDDLFSMIPSSSKRMYEYEWISPMEYSAELKAMKDSVCETTLHSDADTDEDDDLLRREGTSLDQVQVSLAYHVQPPEFAMDPQNTSVEEVSPTKVKTEGSETGQNFTGKPNICSICGTLCPDSLFLEEHIKLIHTDSAQVLQALQSTASSSSSTVTAICNSSAESRKEAQGQNVDGSKSADATGVTQEGSHVKKEIKLEGGYECGDCGRHFNYLGNLRQHQRIHTGEKPFMCPECGERFRHAARLKNHRLIHSGAESPYPCPQCGKGFSVLSGLKRHQRVHTGESPYACPQCGRRFKELGNLYTHQRIHSGATPYCCQNCGRSFRHLGTFKSHRCTPAL